MDGKRKPLFSRNKLVLALMDIVIVAIACFFSRLLITEIGYYSSYGLNVIGRTFIIYAIITQLIFRLFDLYHNITRYENGLDYLTYIFANIVSTTIIIGVNLICNLKLLTTKELILSGILISVCMISYRVLIRFMLMNLVEKENIRNDKTEEEYKQKNLLIIGAGAAARDIIKVLRDTLNHKYNIIGIVDDSPYKYKYSLSGIKILGNRYDIPKICKKYEVEEIFFTISRISPKDKKEILNICQETNASVRRLPSTEDMIKNKNIVENMKKVEIEDLLARDAISLDNHNIESLIKDNVILVTGGGGSIGSELCRQIISYEPKKLVIFDIYENNLYDIQMELNFKYPIANIDAIVGSVRDKKKLEEVFKTYKPSLVFHAAAHKHVPLMEVSPLEAIKNNVFGTKNVADMADKYHVKKMILVSTDKAVNPTNIMGATKRMCEIIIQDKNRKSKTEYAAVRFGNVLGSNGSVIPLFKKQIEKGGPITVTDKEITRFFMTIPEAVGLILQAMTYANGGEIFVLDMGEPVKIYDLAVNLIKLSGLRPNIDIPIEVTGLRPGEKLTEELLMNEEGLLDTAHNKIFIGKPLEISSEEVEKRINLLSEIVESEEHSIEEIKDVMKQAVPTYCEPEKRNKKIRDMRGIAV